MRYYDTTFFCDKEDSHPRCHISKLGGEEDLVHGKTITLRINMDDTNGFEHPSVIFFLDLGEQQLINFKNSVISAFDDYMRRRYGK